MENIDEYQSELGERATKIVFESFYNLRLRKVPKKKGQRTPDYEIIDEDGNTVAVSEVKSFVDIIGPTDPKKKIDYEKFAEISKARDRNHRSKLRKQHGKALSQLAGYTNIPTLVIFVSFDMTDYIDMAQVLQEHKDLYPDSKMADAYILMKVHQGIIPSNTFDIKEMIRLMHNNEIGENFGHEYLSLNEAWRRSGALPITFRLD